MKINTEQKKYIQKKFSTLNTKEDLLMLLNEAKVMMYGEESYPFKLKDLTLYANPNFCAKRYTTFTIPKKNGGNRTIHAPVKKLRSILRVLNFVLQALHEPNPAATGFVQNKSIVDNAKAHIGRNYVYNLDLKDFFHSFDRNRVKMGFLLKPIDLSKGQEKIAFLLACLCTHPFVIDGEMRNVLPQGSPTSPTITNILCHNLDRRLNGLAKRFNLTFTRYADDITFSSSYNVFNDKDFQIELRRIIEKDQKLEINPKKTRLQKNGFRKEATGLVINDKVNVRKKYTKQLRMWLYYWEAYGYEKAEQLFKRDYKLDKGHVKSESPNMEYVISGKLEFLKMVKGENDPTYSKLQARFLKMSSGSSFISNILSVWENQGIEKAVMKFKDRKTKNLETTTILTL